MTLYIVATPIGNLGDVTFRAVETLKTVDLIVAEDTRQTKKLLDRYEIKTGLATIHQHSQVSKLEQMIARMENGESIALVSDAGTPNISDPGGELVEMTRQAGIQVVPIPGASAVTTILSVAGIPSDSFMFVGFLPKKKGRQTLLKEMANLDVPIVFFESPNRIAKTLVELNQYLGDRELVIGRELTKMYEEILKLPTTEAMKHFSQHVPKGEFVIVITLNYN